MSYIRTTDGFYPLSENDIRNANPNVSYAMPFNPGNPYAWVFPTPQPTFDPIIQFARQVAPVLTGDKYFEAWEVIQKFDNPDDEAAAIAADAQAKAERITSEIITSTQKRLDDFAKTRNYDGILSACTYATSTVPKFQSEGQYCVDARDQTWSALYTILEEVQGGHLAPPTGYADIESLLPELAWPQ